MTFGGCFLLFWYIWQIGQMQSTRVLFTRTGTRQKSLIKIMRHIIGNAQESEINWLDFVWMKSIRDNIYVFVQYLLAVCHWWPISLWNYVAGILEWRTCRGHGFSYFSVKQISWVFNGIGTILRNVFYSIVGELWPFPWKWSTHWTCEKCGPHQNTTKYPLKLFFIQCFPKSLTIISIG